MRGTRKQKTAREKYCPVGSMVGIRFYSCMLPDLPAFDSGTAKNSCGSEWLGKQFACVYLLLAVCDPDWLADVFSFPAYLLSDCKEDRENVLCWIDLHCLHNLRCLWVDGDYSI